MSEELDEDAEVFTLTTVEGSDVSDPPDRLVLAIAALMVLCVTFLVALLIIRLT